MCEVYGEKYVQEEFLGEEFLGVTLMKKYKHGNYFFRPHRYILIEIKNRNVLVFQKMKFKKKSKLEFCGKLI